MIVFLKKHKSLLKFFGWLALGGLTGFVLAMGLRLLTDHMDEWYGLLEIWLIQAIVPLQFTVFLLLAAASLILYAVGRGRMQRGMKAPEDHAELVERGDRLLGCGLTANTVNTLLCYGLFGIGAAVIPIREHLLSYALNVGILFLVMAFQTVYSVKVIGFLKRCNPEKKGDPLDMKFEANWLESCDEAERMAIYQASYHSFKFMSGVIMALWVLVVLCGILLNTGIFSIVLITTVWLCHSVSYQVYAARFSRKKLNN